MQVGEIQWHVTGDIGGAGVSRFRFTRQDAADITGADVHAAAVASQNIFGAAASSTPSSCTWTCFNECNIYDAATGVVQGPLPVSTPPAAIPGTGTGNYTAGAGARINWRTSTLVGRRLLRGATFVVPLSQNAYTSLGAISASFVTALGTGAATYLTAMTTAVLYPVVWHRPLKGTTVGGMTGTIFAGNVSTVPAGLRSRRS